MNSVPDHPAAAVTRVIISTSDLTRALRLYRDVLGFAGEPSGETAMLGRPGSVMVMLHQRATDPSDAAVAAAFSVDDLDQTVSAWTAAGGSVVDPPADQPWGERMAVVRDTDGHIVCLIQR
ncbi:MAG TPA: VOC family protein [Microlunatus sp.]